MKNDRFWPRVGLLLTCLLLLVLPSCATLLPVPPSEGGPRTSTPQERANVQTYIDAASDTLLVAATFKGISTEQHALGQAVLQEFRDQVVASETVPVDWPRVWHNALRLTIIVLSPRAREMLQEGAKPPPSP